MYGCGIASSYLGLCGHIVSNEVGRDMCEIRFLGPHHGFFLYYKFLPLSELYIKFSSSSDGFTFFVLYAYEKIYFEKI